MTMTNGKMEMSKFYWAMEWFLLALTIFSLIRTLWYNYVVDNLVAVWVNFFCTLIFMVLALSAGNRSRIYVLDKKLDSIRCENDRD